MKKPNKQKGVLKKIKDTRDAIETRLAIPNPQTPKLDMSDVTKKLSELSTQIETLGILVAAKEKGVKKLEEECPKSKEYKDRIVELEDKIKDLEK